ncbi:hypothetical protein [Falsibacillus pallidus]|uniref:hypothetical protein n=1 Tax=Falsibacillus pallidus TaxID=493781 RepID=UPI003D989413
MNIKSQISKGYINEVIDFIKKNLQTLPTSELKDDPLLISIKNDCDPVMNFLLKEKYHMLCPHDKQLSFLINTASRNYHKELIKFIQDISFSKSELTKALDYSSSSCDVFTVKILLDAGADLMLISKIIMGEQL